MLYSTGDNIFHQILNFILFELFFILAFSSHIQTMFTDPGTVSKGTLNDEYLNPIEQRSSNQQELDTSDIISMGIMYKCTKCSCVRPARAHHCSVCQRCIKSKSYYVIYTLKMQG